jgi:D-xylonolactonase
VPRWLVYSLIAILLWGGWGVLFTAAGKEMEPLQLQVLYTPGLLPVALVLLASKNLRRGRDFGRGIAAALATGLCGGTGNLALAESLRSGGQASIVYPLTSLYPLLTVLLARVWLRERLNRVQLMGIPLALAAMYVFNGGQSLDALTALRNVTAPWMLCALATLVLFGLAAVFQKISTNRISNELSTIFFAVAFIPIALVILAIRPIQWRVPGRHLAMALAVGALIAVGTLVLFAAYRWGKASVVTAVTGLYPGLTAILAVPIFGEELTWLQRGAIVLALAAGMALTYEKSASPVPEVVVDGANRCGEAPIWDAARARLVWTDIPANLVHQWTGGAASVISRDLNVSGIALNADGALVLAGAGGLHLWRGPGDCRPIVTHDGPEPLTFNDIIADPRGRIYAGTIHWGDSMIKPGKLYLIDGAGTLRVVDDGIELANGLGFSPDDRTLYFADSSARRIYEYDVERESGALSNRRVFVQVPRDEGLPDGLTVDAEGFVWCAQWYGAQVVRYDPDGKVERRIALPVRQVSSVAFGGPALDELFVTTAAEPWKSDLAPPGYDWGTLNAGGALYRIRPGVRGRAEHRAGF